MSRKQSETGETPLSAPTRKRAQQDRAEVTKEKLRAATLAVILRDGWSGTSTLKVCEEAQVSNGAQTHHYPKKNDLLIAALTSNRDSLRSRTEQRLANPEPASVSLSDQMGVLRLTKKDEPYFYATVESLVAARTDEILREDVKRIDQEWIENLRSESKERVGDLPGDLSADDLMELTLCLVRGLVVHRGAHQNPKHLDKLFDLWCDIVERAVDTSGEPV